jgi:hypothetical protein
LKDCETGFEPHVEAPDPASAHAAELELAALELDLEATPELDPAADVDARLELDPGRVLDAKPEFDSKLVLDPKPILD